MLFNLIGSARHRHSTSNYVANYNNLSVSRNMREENQNIKKARKVTKLTSYNKVAVLSLVL
jgi:hypothetical protein